MSFLGGSDGKESACNAGELGSIAGLGRFPGGGLGNPLQYSCLDNPHGQISAHRDSPGKNTRVGCQALLQEIFPTQGLMGWDCLALQADSLPSEPPRKLKNTGVGSLSLVQRNFLTQESNWGLLHCRWIFYQLSYLGSSPTPRQPVI